MSDSAILQCVPAEYRPWYLANGFDSDKNWTGHAPIKGFAGGQIPLAMARAYVKELDRAIQANDCGVLDALKESKHHALRGIISRVHVVAIGHEGCERMIPPDMLAAAFRYWTPVANGGTFTEGNFVPALACYFSTDEQVQAMRQQKTGATSPATSTSPTPPTYRPPAAPARPAPPPETATAQFTRLVAEEKARGVSGFNAIAIVGTRHPDLHARYLAEASGR